MSTEALFERIETCTHRAVLPVFRMLHTPVVPTPVGRGGLSSSAACARPASSRSTAITVPTMCVLMCDLLAVKVVQLGSGCVGQPAPPGNDLYWFVVSVSVGFVVSPAFLSAQS